MLVEPPIEVASVINRKGLARAGSWFMTEGQLVSAHLGGGQPQCPRQAYQIYLPAIGTLVTGMPVCAMFLWCSTCLGNPRVCATLAFATSLFIVSLPPPLLLSQLAKLCNSCKYQHCNCFQTLSILFVVFLTL